MLLLLPSHTAFASRVMLLQGGATRAHAPVPAQARAAARCCCWQPHAGRGLQPIQGDSNQISAQVRRSRCPPPPPPPLPPPPASALQHGLGGGQSTLDVVEQSLHSRFDSLTRAGARLPALPQQHTSPSQPASSSPSSRHAILPPSSSSPKPSPSSSSRLPTSASASPAAMLQSAAAALADIKHSGSAAAISERWLLLRRVFISFHGRPAVACPWRDV